MTGVWLRRWWQSPLLTGQFAFTIAIGMGAATALASLMLALGYQPLPFRDPGQLVAVWERGESGSPFLALSGADIAGFARGARNIFSTFGALMPPRAWLLDRKGAIKIRECYIEASAFSDLGIRPVLGRPVHQDDQPLAGGSGASPAWISYRLWRSRYGGSPSVIGRTIGIADSAEGRDEVQASIAGVFPPGVRLPLPFENTTDVWCILSSDIVARVRQAQVFFGLGRLRPGVTVAQAQAALDIVAERLAQEYSFEHHRVPVVESLEAIAQGPARKTMGLLALGLGFVFLVGCVNLAILMGAEGKRRQREIAIRTALGASRWQLWQDVAWEKCLLTLLSVGLGVAFAYALLHVLAVLVPAAGLGPPLEHAPPLNVAILLAFAAFALAAALVWSTLLVRAADAPESSRALAAAGCGPGYTGAGDSSRGANRWRLILLATQAGVGICLLSAAALTAGTYAAASAANLGPAPRHTVLLSVAQRDNFEPTDAQVAEFDEGLLSRLGRLPGTHAIALASLFPPLNSPVSFTEQGDWPGTDREANYPTPVSPGYFRTLGIPVLFGRGFNESDTSGSEPVAVISLDLAEQNWSAPGRAVGSEIFFGSPGKSNSKKGAEKAGSKEPSQTHFKIVGVVADFTGYWSQKPTPTVYLPLAQAAFALGGDVILRTTTPRAVAALAQQALNGMAIPATVSDVSTMEARWRATVTRPFARMAGMLMLALLGLGLSVQGVYAVTAATVAARRHELAVRAVLGAMPGRLAWTVTRELVIAVTVGSALGVIAALNLRTVLRHWLGPVATWEFGPVAAAVVLLALTAAAGCYFPARAAARANPVDVLRQG